MSDQSDYDDDMDSPHSGTPHSMTPGEDPKKHARAQHNALERRRRDNIKDMYSSLRESVPDMNNERASRAVILKKSIDAIEEKTALHSTIVEATKKLTDENAQLEEEIRRLKEERAIIRQSQGGSSNTADMSRVTSPQ